MWLLLTSYSRYYRVVEYRRYCGSLIFLFSTSRHYLPWNISFGVEELPWFLEIFYAGFSKKKKWNIFSPFHFFVMWVLPWLCVQVDWLRNLLYSPGRDVCSQQGSHDGAIKPPSILDEHKQLCNQSSVPFTWAHIRTWWASMVPLWLPSWIYVYHTLQSILLLGSFQEVMGRRERREQ